jgi:DNA-binding response OmpR family regulator
MSFTSFFGGKKTILIVEDDVMLRATLEERFQKAGYKVLTSGDAEEVLVLVANKQPDVLVLDLILPLKDGITLLEELRTSGCTVPVFLLSNLLGSGELRNDAERLGASFHNKTSTSPDELVALVTKTLEESN